MPSPLEAVRRISEALFQYTHVDDMIRRTLRTALDVIGGDAGSVLLADDDTKQLVFRYVIGEKADLLHGTGIPWDRGIAGAVFTSGQPEVVVDVQEDSRHFAQTDTITGYRSRDMIVVPLKRHGGEPIGVLEVLNTVEGQVGCDDLDILVVIGAIAAAAIEQTRAVESLRQREAQLRQAQKMEAMGRLAGGIAHDFNNLLTVIRGYSELILNRLAPTDPIRNDMEEIKTAGNRAAGLTSQLLAFSRNQVREPRVLDLNTLVANVEKMLRRLIGENVHLVTVLEPVPGPIKADQGQLEQVLMNLAVNARDAMPQGGTLVIETATVELDGSDVGRFADVLPGPYVMLAVSDTGCGMDENTQAHMFEPFFTTKEPGKGTGLGLSIVYGIVKQSGGHMAVSSEPGQGTMFKVYFPRVDRQVKEVPPYSTTRPSPRGSETVLVVEDEEQVRALECGILQASGYRVLAAGDGREALRMCHEYPGPIHLLMTDIVMPHMSGQDLAHQVAPLRPAMKVLYVSGYADDTVVRSSTTQAHHAFIQKPFDADTLLHNVRHMLDGTEKTLSGGQP